MNRIAPGATETSARTKVERVAEYLRESIVGGRLERGAKLKQSELAQHFKISPTPVREALKILEAEGYVHGVSHRGAVVAPLDLEMVEEVVELRVLLEGRLALAALGRMSEQRLATLRDLQRRLEREVADGDTDAVRVTNFRFHAMLYGTAEQPETLRFVNILWARYPFDLINRIQGRVAVTAREHAAIIEALTTGDGVGLVDAVSAHIRSGWRQLKERLAATERPAEATKSSE